MKKQIFVFMLSLFIILGVIITAYVLWDGKTVSVKPPHGLNRKSGHETMSQNSKYLPCSLREIFVTLGDGQKWSKVCK